jgi:hypothetical protein
MADQQSPERDAIANEVWGSAEPSPDAPKNDIAESAAPVADAAATAAPAAEADPWAGVPSALREEVEGLRAKVKGLDTIDFRLKQTESRLGSVQNELHAAKEAAKAVANAPSNAQIAEAAASQGEWNELKEQFPEWTKATEGRLAAERAEILKQLPNTQALRDEIKAESNTELEKVKLEMVGHVVALKHPNWREVNDSAEFKQWNAENGNRDSFSPIEVIAILDDFAAYKATRKSPKEIAAERKERLELSQTTEGRRLPPTKSEADMTEAELRAAVAKQVWGTP